MKKALFASFAVSPFFFFSSNILAYSFKLSLQGVGKCFCVSHNVCENTKSSYKFTRRVLSCLNIGLAFINIFSFTSINSVSTLWCCSSSGKLYPNAPLTKYYSRLELTDIFSCYSFCCKKSKGNKPAVNIFN